MGKQKCCTRRMLARSETIVVNHCSCGMVHIYAGPMTLHMQREECEAFTTVLACAMVRLAEMDSEAKKPQLRVVPPPGMADGAAT